MDKEEMNTGPKASWAIAPDWFQQNNRSLSALIQGHLCPKCAKRLGTGEKEKSPDALMATIQGCCAHTPDFINERLPILESIFRVFLVGGNQPLSLEELGRKLSEWRNGDPYRTSHEILSRLLKNDRYYGFREVKES